MADAPPYLLLGAAGVAGWALGRQRGGRGAPELWTRVGWDFAPEQASTFWLKSGEWEAYGWRPVDVPGSPGSRLWWENRPGWGEWGETSNISIDARAGGKLAVRVMADQLDEKKTFTSADNAMAYLNKIVKTPRPRHAGHRALTRHEEIHGRGPWLNLPMGSPVGVHTNRTHNNRYKERMWSVQDENNKGRVEGHVYGVRLKDAHFSVGEAGAKRVTESILAGKPERGVVALAKGTLTHADLSIPSQTTRVPKGAKEITYDPRRGDIAFMRKDKNKRWTIPVASAKEVWMLPCWGVWAVGVVDQRKQRGAAAKEERFSPGDILLLDSPHTRGMPGLELQQVNYRGPLRGTDKAVVVLEGQQMTVPMEWLVKPWGGGKRIWPSWGKPRGGAARKHSSRVSKCISGKVRGEGWEQRRAVAACLSMERGGSLRPDGSYIPKGSRAKTQGWIPFEGGYLLERPPDEGSLWIVKESVLSRGASSASKRKMRWGIYHDYPRLADALVTGPSLGRYPAWSRKGPHFRTLREAKKYAEPAKGIGWLGY